MVKHESLTHVYSRRSIHRRVPRGRVLRVRRLVVPGESMIGRKMNRVGTDICSKPCFGFLTYGPQAPEVLAVGLTSVYPWYQVFRCRRAIIRGLNFCDGSC